MTTTKGVKKKRINTRVKGRKNEYKAKTTLEEEGYKVIIAPPPARWAKETDFFGVWDVIGVNGDEVRFVQVKSNSNWKKIWDKYKGWDCPDNCTTEVWVYWDRVKKPDIYIL